MPEIRKEMEVPRFLWELMTGYNALKGKKVGLPRFYEQQGKKMERFDRQHPGHLRPGPPLPESRQPTFPVPERPMIVAGSSHPPATKKEGPAQASNKNEDEDEDEDAEGSEEEVEPVSKPTKVTVSKVLKPVPKKRQETESESGEEPEEPAKVQRTKPVAKPAQIRRPKKNETVSDEDWEVTDEEERRERRKTKGKSKEVSEEESEPEPETKKRPADVIKVAKKQLADDADSRKKRPPVKSNGEEREIPCVRCEKQQRTCFQQVGGLVACVACAKIKMKCEPTFMPPTRRKPAAATSAPPPVQKKPAAAKRTAAPAYEEPKAKRQKVPASPAPIASSSKKKSFKSAEVVGTSEDESEAAPPRSQRRPAPPARPARPSPSPPPPAPVASGSQRKSRTVVKPAEESAGEAAPAQPKSQKKLAPPAPPARPARPAPPALPARPSPPAPPAPVASGARRKSKTIVSSGLSDGEPAPAPAPSAGCNVWPHSHWPENRRNFDAVECYYGKFL